jgi:hypothetical protein
MATEMHDKRSNSFVAAQGRTGEGSAVAWWYPSHARLAISRVAETTKIAFLASKREWHATLTNGVSAETYVADPATEESKKLQNETVTKLRTLSHDLSNYIETIMQASYLLAQAKLDDNNKKWLELVDKASQDAARVNREIREILRAQS